MPYDLDSFEQRQKKLRKGWIGEGPEPGTSAFGERARERRNRLREGALEEKPVSIQGRTKQIEYREDRDKDILEKAGE